MSWPDALVRKQYCNCLEITIRDITGLERSAFTDHCKVKVSLSSHCCLFVHAFILLLTSTKTAQSSLTRNSAKINNLIITSPEPKARKVSL